MNSMHKQSLLILTFSLVMLAGSTASAQIAESDKSLVGLPDSDREQLTQLVNEFLRYQSSQRWDLLYDLFSPRFVQPVTRTEWVQKRETLTAEGRMMHIVDFALKRVMANDPFDNQYSFVGCANVFRDGQIQFTNAHVDVIFEKDAWRIADYGMFATCLPPEMECKK